MFARSYTSIWENLHSLLRPSVPIEILCVLSRHDPWAIQRRVLNESKSPPSSLRIALVANYRTGAYHPRPSFASSVLLEHDLVLASPVRSLSCGPSFSLVLLVKRRSCLSQSSGDKLHRMKVGFVSKLTGRAGKWDRSTPPRPVVSDVALQQELAARVPRCDGVYEYSVALRRKRRQIGGYTFFG